MTKEKLMQLIKTWEDEAEHAEQELRHAEEMCRMYYKALDDEEWEE